MSLDYETLQTLRTHHPAWLLLRADHAPLIASFLHRAFISPNVRMMSAVELAELLEDELYALRLHMGADAFPKSGLDYLNEWANPEKAWLRKFYRQDSDEAQFDLTPATEKAIAWLGTLAERSFVGTESRLLTVFELLRQMQTGSETDPKKRVAELQARRKEIDLEIGQVLAGDMPMLDDTAIKDRFQQFMQTARELMSDFREVEFNFRVLDRQVRERIALWQGSKGALLEQIMAERDTIADSDQGRSFKAFWDFLLSNRRQEELSNLLAHVLTLPAVSALQPEARVRRIHYDWLEAGEHTQQTVAQLSQQLRRFLDDKAWLENKRIMDILHRIELNALAVRDNPPLQVMMVIANTAADLTLAMERPLYNPPIKTVLSELAIQIGESDIDASALYNQVVVDSAQLSHHIRRALQNKTQVSLADLIATYPLQHGLAELVGYLHLANERFKVVIDENQLEEISWTNLSHTGASMTKVAHLPRVIFVR